MSDFELQVRGSKYKSREAKIVSGRSAQRLGKLMQRAEAGTAGNNRNCWELLEQPGKLTQRVEAGTTRNSWNCRELLEQPGKLTQRAETGTAGKADAEGRSWNCWNCGES